MDAFEGKLAEQVRLYKDLYDPSMRDHRDSQIILREIATTMAKFYACCKKSQRDLHVVEKYAKKQKSVGPHWSSLFTKVCTRTLHSKLKLLGKVNTQSVMICAPCTRGCS